MARKLSVLGTTDAVYTSTTRQMLFKVLLFDADLDALADIVLGRATQIPLNLTDNVVEVSVDEEVENASRANCTLQQQGGFPIPHQFLGNKILQVLITDARISAEKEGEFFSLFLGPCIGQPGYTRMRSEEGGVITVQAVDRSFYYNRKKLNSPEFFQGQDLGLMAVNIATTSDSSYGMGLEREEILFGSTGTTLRHTKASVRDVGFVEGLDLILFLDNLRVSWNGEGKFVARDLDFQKAPARRYRNEDQFVSISWPQEVVDVFNCVKIVGLSSVATKIVHNDQILSEVNGSLGYFKKVEKVPIYYSDDRRARAQNVRITKKKFNGWMPQLFMKAKLEARDDFHVILIVKGIYLFWIFIIFLIIYVVLIILSAVLNGIPIWGGAISEALWIAAAIFLAIGLAIMQQLGTYHIWINGQHFEMVYKEVVGRACWSNIPPFQIRERVIENHFVDSQTLADSLALRELRKETVKKLRRSAVMIDDPGLETDDVIELPDGTRWYITSIKRRYSRNTDSDALMEVGAWVIRSGVEFTQSGGWSYY